MKSICAGAGAVVALIGVVWLLDYRAGLRPELILSLPVERCEQIVFGPWGFDCGGGVDELCSLYGKTQRPVFALRGKTAVKYVPTVFHGVHGNLQAASADEGTVYFYHYRERYIPDITAP
jgi:hypothetical protein